MEQIAARLFLKTLIFASILLWTAACVRQDRLEDRTPEQVAELSSGPVRLSILADPPKVRLDRDILLTLRVSAPSNVDVSIPRLAGRLAGFSLDGEFTREALSGKTAREYCYRLKPEIAAEYRIGPMAVIWSNRSGEASSDGWFQTPPIVFQASAVAPGAPGADIGDIVGPRWIPPPLKTVAIWVGAFLGLAGLVWLAWLLNRRVRRAIQLRRMSPRERALLEISSLVQRNLVGKGRIKEFYLELTMIVRRYIERAHAVRAPELTTEEFLQAAVGNPDFPRNAVLSLRTFLNTGDLVKFAAYRPAPEVIEQTLATARNYIDTDERECAPADATP